MNHQEWTLLLENRVLPAAIIDLDAFDRNVERIRKLTISSGKKLRIASKSIRVPFLMKRALDLGGGAFQGLLTYSVRESVFLYQQGFRDLVIAYPTLQKADLEAALPVLKTDPAALTFMVDSQAHLEFLSQFHTQERLDRPLSISIDLDVSYRPLGIHIGVQRSPIRTLPAFERLLEGIRKRNSLSLVGVMGYEAQIAGLADTNPFAPLLNPAKKLIKWLSIRDVAQKREKVAALLKAKGIAITFFNGGGTGSLSSTLREDAITEATAGSGFLQSHLFDYYANNQNEAAEFVALRVSRAPDAHVVTCHGGGIIGSGEIGNDKAMIPVLPLGISLLPTEGCGEVQTPLRKKSSTTLKPGQPVLFRPAKTGEPLERFREVHLFSDQKWFKSVPTYRGMNEEFQ